MILLLIILSVLLVILFLWITGFLFATDFAVPLRNPRRFKNILVIFPHADDETITCGGSLHRFSAGGSAVTLAILTRGEKGPKALHEENLADIRTREAQAAAAHLGISRLIQEDFGDGELSSKQPELATFIATLIEQTQPDLLITYDLAGLYGHADHITCSEIVTGLKKARFPEIPAWYVTFPKRLLARVKPPEQLATDPHFREKHALPTHKIFIGISVFPKIKAWYAYKSQRAALARDINKFLPVWLLWFFMSMMLFEYFAEVS